MDHFKKRSQYRVPAQAIEKLNAKVFAPGGRVLEGNVLDASSGGLAARIPTTSAVDEGEELEILISTRESLRSVRLNCHVRNVTREGDTMRCGFEFADPAQLYAQLDTTWWSYFNRRELYRVPTRARDDFEVTLFCRGTSIRCAPRDLSGLGMGLVLPDSQADLLEGQTELRVGFQLPELDLPFILTSVLVHRSTVDGESICGIAYDPDRTLNLDKLADAISKYALGRRRSG